jgi:UDP-3-O-[3-hydroxymyristoyl] glucosamine N-acyltransferase
MIDAQGRGRVVIVGFKEATISQEFQWWMSDEIGQQVEIVPPDKLVLSDDTAYIVSVTKEIALRKLVIDQLQNSALATFIHKSVVLHGDTHIGPGVFIGPHTSIYFNAEIGPHSIIAPYSMVSHGTKIGVSTMLHPGSMIAGSCTIGDYCLLGMRSTVIDKIDVCDNVFIGAGSLVTKNITESGNYVGSPARKVK